MRTLFEIEYKEAGSLRSTRIPAGTPVKRATNLPREAYWAEPWRGMSKMDRNFCENVGFLILPCEVGEDLPGL